MQGAVVWTLRNSHGLKQRLHWQTSGSPQGNGSPTVPSWRGALWPRLCRHWPQGPRTRFLTNRPFLLWWGITSHQDSLGQTPDPLKRNSAFRGRCLLLWRKSSAKKEMILILIETRFTALSSQRGSMGLEISSHGLVAANSQVSKILNWHDRTNTFMQ